MKNETIRRIEKALEQAEKESLQQNIVVQWAIDDLIKDIRYILKSERKSS